MKIALIGATGFVGSAVLKEALDRGIQVTAIVRQPEKLQAQKNLTIIKGDVIDSDNLSELFKGNDVVVSAYNAGWANPDLYNEYLEGSQSIQEAVKKIRSKTLYRIGGSRQLIRGAWCSIN